MAWTLVSAALLLAAAAAAALPESPLPLAELPTQTLAPNQCALVLWERATGRRVAMLTQRPDAVRVVSGGMLKVVPRTGGDSDQVAGFAARALYTDGAIRIATALAIVATDTAGNAIVRNGVISVTGGDGIEVVAPVAGLAGCSR